MLSGALRFKALQQSLLYDAIKQASTGCNQITVSDILDWLSLSDSTSAISIRMKLQYFADIKIFEGREANGCQKLFQHPKPIQILSLSGFRSDERKVIAELLLDDLRSYLVEYGPGQNDFILVLDECQNLRLTSGMPTSFFLSQGRKYGCEIGRAHV